ncbi:hypothetical protein T05_10180 [Trichinella murrelli]|uniref:Uncharacterized protein n=1 Tax=Trichinella murrelli TaxID=144512 RepID=A0A0V0TRE8_9BILA|nr:hypothetical protein T05_10180 [Trichinella murrelli]
MGPSSLLFPNFSYILILFLEKNRFYENFEISWAIDFAVFAFWRVFAKSHWTQSDSCGKIAFKNWQPTKFRNFRKTYFSPKIVWECRKKLENNNELGPMYPDCVFLEIL